MISFHSLIIRLSVFSAVLLVSPLWADSTIDVTPQVSTTPVTLTSMFNGLSYGKETLWASYFDAHDVKLIGLFKRLGPGVLRIGGTSVDHISWDGSGRGRQANSVAPKDIQRLAAFLQATQWKVLYAINYLNNTPANAVAEMTVVSQILGDRLLGVEIGNEPEYYRKTIPDAVFVAGWDKFATAIHNALPSVVLTGPACAWDVTKVMTPFAAAERNLVTLLTYHYYVADAKSPASTIPRLLSRDHALYFKAQTTSVAAGQNNISGGFRVDECNSLYNGGRKGVSDTFGSALWAIDYLFAIAATPYSTGVNFHGGWNAPYTPIESSKEGYVRAPRPLYYGLLLFSLMDNGTLMTTTVQAPVKTFSAYSVAMNDGSLAVVLNNKSPTVSETVRVHSGGAAFGQATSLLLTSPSLDSTSQVTLGGAAVNPDGTWNPTYNPVPVADGQISVTVPAASALLLQIQTGATKS